MKTTFMTLIAIGMMLHVGEALAAKPIWSCSIQCDDLSPTGCTAMGVSAKHAILALKAKMAKEKVDPNLIEGATCKNSKTKQTKTYASLKTLLGDGPNGEKSGP
jgi:hypothetical protein